MGAAKVMEFLQSRIVPKKGIVWPWWIAYGMTGLAVGAAGVAMWQRDPVLPPGVDEVLGLVAIAAWLGHLVFARVPPLVLGLVVNVAVLGLMVSEPVPLDFAPMILTLLAGELAATSSVRLSAVLASGSAGALVALDLFTAFEGSPFWLVAIAVAWDVGFIFQWQMRMIEQERMTAEARAQRAAVAERQRIAREVHDVIAHSLSVTLLHLTAARHSLEDGDSDVAEAVDALRDAERLGRQAMTDIRLTVGLLENGGGGTQPMPGVPEIAGLVDDFRAAGMRVAYELSGEPSSVPQSAGLGLYRIAQESLSNVAKHAPGAQVRATLNLAGDPCRFTVWNSLPGTSRSEAADGGGSGLRGIRERAELMGGICQAGPSGTGWLVDVRFPAPSEQPETGRSCSRTLLGRALGTDASPATGGTAG